MSIFPYLIRQILIFIITLSLSAGVILGTPVNNAVSGLFSAFREETELSSGSPWMDSDLSDNIYPFMKTSPDDDFHLYAGKDSLIKAKYLEGYERWNYGAILQEKTEERVHELLENESIKGHDIELSRTYYNLLTDWDTRNKTGFSELKSLTDPILKAEDYEELNDYIYSDEASFLVGKLVNVKSDKSFNDPDHYSVCLYPWLLLLEDSAEYSDMTELGKMNLDYQKAMFAYYGDRLGMDKAEALKMYDEYIETETALSKAIFSEEESMKTDYIEKINNEMTFDELKGLTRNFPLTELIEKEGYKYDGKYIVTQPEYIKLLDGYYTEENFEKIRNLFYVSSLLGYGWYTDRDSFNYDEDKYTEILGIVRYEGSEDAAFDEITDRLYGPLQKAYAEKYASAKDKERLENICLEIMDTYREILKNNEWASDETKEEAIRKLDTMNVCVGYPDIWTDYSSLSLEGLSLLQSIREIEKFYCDINRERTGKERDRDRWDFGINILECNAQYSLTDNSIYLFLGMMDEPYFSEDMTDEELYASIAAFWMGHEISHSFDPSGAQYDEKGRLSNWWKKEDKEKYDEKIEKLESYLDTIEPFKDYHVNGSNVDTEMMADITGMQCALMMVKDKKDFDYDLFFRTYARMNLVLLDYSSELSNLLMDEHPLSYLRTNVPLQQFEEFYDTYDIKERDNMYLPPEDRVTVW